MNQHAILGLQPGQLVGKNGRHEHGGDGGERRRRHVRRRGSDQFLPRDHFRSERAEREASHAVAHRDGRYVGTGFDNPAKEFLPEQSLLDQAHCPEHVEEVEPAGLDRDAHVVRVQGARRQWPHLQRLDRSTFVRRQHPTRFLRQV